MSESSPLWKEIWEALAWNRPRRDETPIHRFNRLVKEHFPEIDVWLDQNTCTAKDITLTISDIKQLKSWHSRPNPNKLGGKIIIFEHGGISAIVDGNNRVAHYVVNNKSHDVAAILAALNR